MPFDLVVKPVYMLVKPGHPFKHLVAHRALELGLSTMGGLVLAQVLQTRKAFAARFADMRFPRGVASFVLFVAMESLGDGGTFGAAKGSRSCARYWRDDGLGRRWRIRIGLFWFVG